MDQDCLMEGAFDSEVWVGATCGCDVHADPVYAFGYHTWIFTYIYFD